jgi:hypothetical protein
MRALRRFTRNPYLPAEAAAMLAVVGGIIAAALQSASDGPPLRCRRVTGPGRRGHAYVTRAAPPSGSHRSSQPGMRHLASAALTAHPGCLRRLPR